MDAEQIKEKDAEIERLNDEVFRKEVVLKKQRELLTRVADVLERSDDWMDQPIHKIVITKLRDARLEACEAAMLATPNFHLIK